MINFGKNLRYLRHRSRVSALAVCKKLGVCTGTYYKYERGEVSPSVDGILTICEILRIEPAELFQDSPWIKRPMTNADWVRSRSDEELSQFLGLLFDSDAGCLDWLKEVKHDV